MKRIKVFYRDDIFRGMINSAIYSNYILCKLPIRQTVINLDVYIPVFVFVGHLEHEKWSNVPMWRCNEDPPCCSSGRTPLSLFHSCRPRYPRGKRSTRDQRSTTAVGSFLKLLQTFNGWEVLMNKYYLLWGLTTRKCKQDEKVEESELYYVYHHSAERNLK